VEENQTRIVKPKLFVWLAVLVAIWLIFISIVPIEPRPGPMEGQSTVLFKASAGGKIILNETSYVENGTSAFDAMQEVAAVGYQDFGEMGVMVESINETKPGEGEFWGLYVDGEMAMVGINSIVIEKDTSIEWKIETIEGYS